MSAGVKGAVSTFAREATARGKAVVQDAVHGMAFNDALGKSSRQVMRALPSGQPNSSYNLVYGVKAYIKRLEDNVELAQEYSKPTPEQTSYVLGVRTAAADLGAQYGIQKLKDSAYPDTHEVASLENRLKVAVSKFDGFQQQLAGEPMAKFVERHLQKLSTSEGQQERLDMLARSAEQIDDDPDMIWRLDLGTRYLADSVSLTSENRAKLQGIRAKVDQHLEQIEVDKKVARLSVQDLFSPTQGG